MSSRGCRRCRGIALPVALVLLAVMTLGAAASTQGAATSLGIAGAMRGQLLARLAAQAALRWCERELMTGSRALAVQMPSPSAGTSDALRWAAIANWSPEAALAVPRTLLSDSRQPEALCLVEQVGRRRDAAASADGPPEAFIFVLTARGFGIPAGPVGPLAASSASVPEVWLQARLRVSQTRGLAEPGPDPERELEGQGVEDAPASIGGAFVPLGRSWRQIVNPPR